jgi:ABC-type nitrate/sulfonate/bicarbonate transport system permease component
MAAIARNRRLQMPGVSSEAVLATAGFLAVWQVVSLFMNPILLPSPVRVAADVWTILNTPTWLGAAGISYLRVLGGLGGGFVIGTGVALLMMVHRRAATFITTYLTFIQGVPSLCWVVMAIIWFRDVETRIWFILVMVTLPGFALQLYDGYRSIPQDLMEMLRSLRPNLFHRILFLYVPALTAPVLTIWKISLGIGIRVVLVAELVGGTLGIGFQLQTAEALINMGLVLAWTVVLVAFVLVTEKVISVLERYALRWRPDEVAHRERLEGMAMAGAKAA